MKIDNSWLGKPVVYKDLVGKEQEAYNATKLAAIMANYGYLESTKISGDKWGADLLFYRSSDTDVKKVQLKGRVTFNRHYIGKNLHIAFPDEDGWYVYPHDTLVDEAQSISSWSKTLSWTSESGGYSWNSPPAWLKKLLKPWKIS